VNLSRRSVDHMTCDLSTLVDAESFLEEPRRVGRNESIEIDEDAVLPQQSDRRRLIPICVLREANDLSLIVDAERLTDRASGQDP